jgi:hypothetical protein
VLDRHGRGTDQRGGGGRGGGRGGRVIPRHARDL